MAATTLELGGMAAPSQVCWKLLLRFCLDGSTSRLQSGANHRHEHETDPSLQGSLWQLVQRTQAHSRFAELYTLPAFEDGWQRQR